MNSSNNDQHQHPSQNYAKLLKQFPKIKFSYELKSYKKVYTINASTSATTTNDNNSIYFIIPKGKKYFVWFKNNECLFLELDNDKQVVNVASKKSSRIFPNDTILYGTHFYYRNVSANSSSMSGSANILYYFTIENIHYYNGINLDITQTYFEKMKTLNTVLKTILLEKTFKVEIGLPYIDYSLDRISNIKPFYSVYCIQKKNSKNEYQNIFYNDLKSSSTFVAPAPIVARVNTILDKGYSKNYNTYKNGNNSNSNSDKYKIFIVSADIQNDIYNITDPDSKQPETDIKLVASVPDYKTSVMMNSLFRNIKENKSLDALEESDDEDEFENTNIDKFVDLSKKIKMKCVFNHKFKKWTPIECV